LNSFEVPRGSRGLASVNLRPGYGKPTQAIEAGVNTQVNTQVNPISDEERLAAVMTLFARVKNSAGAGDDEATDFLTSGETSCRNAD
jgi:hypothetical protein